MMYLYAERMEVIMKQVKTLLYFNGDFCSAVFRLYIFIQTKAVNYLNHQNSAGFEAEEVSEPSETTASVNGGSFRWC
jgi:hypothetical protein